MTGMDSMAERLHDGTVRIVTRGMCLRQQVTFAVVTVLSMAFPTLALGADATDGDWYKEFMGGGGSRASDEVQRAFGLQGRSPDEQLFPNVRTALAQLAGIIVALVPAIFVIKFAGRALLSLIYPNTDSTRSDSTTIPNFFKTAEERGKNTRIDNSSAWYLVMGKEFLLYFAVAVGVATIIGIIVALIGFFTEGAPVTGTGYLDHFTA